MRDRLAFLKVPRPFNGAGTDCLTPAVLADKLPGHVSSEQMLTKKPTLSRPARHFAAHRDRHPGSTSQAIQTAASMYGPIPQHIEE